LPYLALAHDGDVGVRGGQPRVGHDVLGVVEPPGAGLVQHGALEGDVAEVQGLTLVHMSAQFKRFLSDRKCM